jgi:hypothetical protein
MLLAPVRLGRRPGLSSQARKDLARIVTLLLSDEAETRDQIVALLAQHGTAEIRTDVVSELIEATRGDAARREPAVLARGKSWSTLSRAARSNSPIRLCPSEWPATAPWLILQKPLPGFARQCKTPVPFPPLYLRIDVIESATGPMISECEGVEPELFFRACSGSEQRFRELLEERMGI